MSPVKKPVRGCRTRRWTVYIVRCAGNSLYTGITNDLARRLKAHNRGKGAKYTASFGPVRLAWRTTAADRSAASVLEARIKKLTHAEKEKLIRGIDKSALIPTKQRDGGVKLEG